MSAHASVGGCLLVWVLSACAAAQSRAMTQSAPSRPAERQLTSIVLLLDRPARLKAASLAAAFELATGRRVVAESAERTASRPAESAPAEEDGFVVGEPPIFVARVGDSIFTVNDFAKRYFEDAGAEARLPAEAAAAVRAHRAWLSVDAMALDTDDERRAAYRTIGRVLAELWSERVVGVVVPQQRRTLVLAAHPNVRDALKTEDPLWSLHSIAMVVDVGPDDAEMNAAIAEARRRWPEFVAALRAKPDVERYVKLAWRDGEEVEHIWAKVERVEDGKVTATIDNQPRSVRNLKQGQRVTVAEAEVEDWLWQEGGKMVGGFTVEVLRKRGAGKDR